MTTHQPKPDDRSDNVEKLQNMVQNTIENVEKAEDSVEFANDDTQIQQIKEKNERRRESIKAMKSEIKDEAQAKENGYH
ncbi:small acid-soluble spore protein Tlp [Heyndrickxia ginsengihumi]|uniref:Small, acid-soluble spore protein Tlp n=1 Tax=Heyndrickxia ginsengihumi TaxID=363870 RepID=A0A0A6VHP6_9BACI|nr:small acid-soluble spore protein Tlp [Heyndrickxia ginsengihumi]KHD86149.1 small acid-soluble spore protein Tlp [Heyndrickxia ginsengihumi]MBE6183345.1 small acid-soluble spore protein Tlp [Bacillus sp. (in: firmicutes)]MCM3024093.1 small acid-soluble spore protein Tlp [Heyndrickxia ginsengihumi]NEY21066.1 small acid-soluble spore protein Tlp [Heyndrickxia ginsengihumi]